MPNQKDIARYLANLQDEVDSAALYRGMAEASPQTSLAQVYQRMAEMEETHAEYWKAQIHEAGGSLPANLAPGWRTRVLIWVAKRFGPQAVVSGAMSRERDGARSYLAQPESRDTAMAGEEQSHERILMTIAGGTGKGMEGGLLAQMEGRHRSGGGNALRAAVLGANDGLVSNLSLVMGVAGANLAGSSILITGLAGLLAGAGSMALGEWLSVQSSRELYEHQISIEADEIAETPKEEEEELALIYQAKGLSESQAQSLAAHIMADQAGSLDTLAREELGVDPQELGGSPWEAALTSFFLFSVGAIIPVAPFIFTEGMTAVIASLSVSAIGLFIIGASITLFTGKNFILSGLRMVLFGLLASGLTFAIGRLIGVSISG
ncbi:MAG: VIT1/CCC1 transporter family protein [Chloroflexi bacterium]|nr:VIT1/CCC1 transporter family protein [Chloroflexota bacterium]